MYYSSQPTKYYIKETVKGIYISFELFKILNKKTHKNPSISVKSY